MAPHALQRHPQPAPGAQPRAVAVRGRRGRGRAARRGRLLRVHEGEPVRRPVRAELRGAIGQRAEAALARAHRRRRGRQGHEGRADRERRPRSPARARGRVVRPGHDARSTTTGLPIKEDATIKIRNRIFLEGNYFVELHPGSPSAEELPSGETLPPNQADFPTQQHQVLQDVLRRDQREDFRIIFDELSTALDGAGAAGFNEAIRYWERAYRDSAQVSEAYLGTEEHDLSRLLKNQGKVFGALARNEDALKGFVTNLNRTVAAFAVQEDNLKATIPQLRDVLKVGRPALQSLNSALPSLRAFARDALPGTRAASPTLDAQIPLVTAAARAGLGGRAAGPRQRPARRGPRHHPPQQGLDEDLPLHARAVGVPEQRAGPVREGADPRSGLRRRTGNSGEPWYKQQQRAFVGLAGESRLFDGNSSYFRVQAGGGPAQLVTTGETGDDYFSRQLFPIEGVRPISPLDEYRPKFRPDQPCELQEVPDLHAENGAAAEDQISPSEHPPRTPRPQAREARSALEWSKLVDHMRRTAQGLPTFDPLVYKGEAEKELLETLDLVRLDERQARGGDEASDRPRSASTCATSRRSWCWPPSRSAAPPTSSTSSGSGCRSSTRSRSS